MFSTDQRDTTNHNASVPLALPEAHHQAVADAYTFMEAATMGSGCSHTESIGLIMGRFQRMLSNGRPDEFDFVRWFRQWLITPQRSLGFASPVAFLDSYEGRQVLINQINMLEGGAYA